MIEKNWLKIGEVARALGVSAKELRYWEQVVPEIRPRRSKGNLRYYHRGELPRLARIRDWLAEGLTVADCRQLLLTGELKQGLGLEIETAPPAAPPAPVRRSTVSVEAAPVPEVAQARQALAALLERLGPSPAPAPRKRARRAPAADPPAEPAPAPDPVPAPAPAPEPKPSRSRRKPPATPSDPDSFGPLFDLG